jgi:TonB family protein
MNICKAALLATLALSLLPAAHAADTAALTDRLHQAEASSSLDSADLKPWHLKLNVQLFDAKGQPSEQVIIEEWWTSPTTYQVAYTFPSYTAIEILNGKDLSRTKDAGSVPFTIRLLHNQVVHPMPKDAEIDRSIPDLRKQTFGKVPLDCIMLDQKIKTVAYPPFGLFPSYCFDPGQTSLRFTYNFGSQMIIRNNLGKFQQRQVSTDILISENGLTHASAHLVTLETDPSMTPPQIDPTTLRLIGKTADLAAGVMTGNKISGSVPIYPEKARQNHVSGSVVIGAVIGTDGHIQSMRLISVPDPDLAISALAAVRTWTYTPYLLNGEPVEVDTKITVNFNFSR